jgi:hypothetical protein
MINQFVTRLERIERVYQRAIRHGKAFIMPDGSQRILQPCEELKGYSDLCSTIDSPHARIIRNAVTDSNGGQMLQLLHAVLNSVDTTQELR